MIGNMQSGRDSDQLYQGAVLRIESELGWAAGMAQTAIAEYAAAYDISPRDVAAAILTAHSLKRGLGYVLSGVNFTG